jgi:hypothetical protein
MNIDLYNQQLNDIIQSEKRYSLRRKTTREEIIPSTTLDFMKNIVEELLRVKLLDPLKFDSFEEKINVLGYTLIETNQNSPDTEERISELCRRFKNELFDEHRIFSSNASLFNKVNNLYIVLVNLFGVTSFRDIYVCFGFILRCEITPP